MNDMIYWIWLSLACSPSGSTFGKLIKEFDDARSIYEAESRKISSIIGFRNSDRSKLEDKSLEVDALIDTGNLVKDPMNMNPVIFLKRSCAENIIPSAIIDLTDVDSLSSDYRKRIRLIPVTRKDQTHVMTGIRVDKVVVLIHRLLASTTIRAII
jgi:hypothetical protein